VIRKAKSAWFYEGEKSVEVYIETDEGFVAACRITRRQIEAWLTNIAGEKHD
jgi:hypothetical protein